MLDCWPLNLEAVDTDARILQQMAMGIVALTGCTLPEAVELVDMLRPHIVIPENPFTVH